MGKASRTFRFWSLTLVMTLFAVGALLIALQISKHLKPTHENDSHNFLHFSNLNISLSAESKINSLCVFQSPRIGNL